MGRPLSVFTLSEAEEETLRSLVRRRTTAQALALRARIVLACAAGDPNQVVARKLEVTPQTVCKWRARFVAQRLDGLHDEPRPGVPRSINDAKVEAVIVATLETMPQGTTHWSSRGMARSSGISTSSVQRIWRAFGLQPHRTETFKLSTDPLFVDKVRDVVGLYMSPPDHALVLCVDEKSQMQALDGTPAASCRSHPARPSGAVMITNAMARRRCSPPSILPPAGCSAAATGTTAQPSSRRFLDAIDAAGAGRLSRYPSGHGQLRHPQGAGHQSLVCQKASLSPPLHSHLRLLAQSGRALVRASDRAPDPPRRSSQHQGIGAGRRRLHRRPQCRTEAIPLDQIRRSNLQLNCQILPKNTHCPRKFLNEPLVQNTRYPDKMLVEQANERCAFLNIASRNRQSRFVPVRIESCITFAIVHAPRFRRR